MKRHGINPTPECSLFSEFAGDFAAVEGVVLPSAHTVLLIAADARGVPADMIRRAAEHLLQSGLTFVCVWGPDCERVHDIFDQAYLGDGAVEPGFTLLHGFVKKSQKTPLRDLRTARQRLATLREDEGYEEESARKQF
jgi:hypothetical protein